MPTYNAPKLMLKLFWGSFVNLVEIKLNPDFYSAPVHCFFFQSHIILSS